MESFGIDPFKGDNSQGYYDIYGLLHYRGCDKKRVTKLKVNLNRGVEGLLEGVIKG